MSYSNLFGNGGTIHATLPGTVQEPLPKGDHKRSRTKSRDQFAYPRTAHSQVGEKHIRLLSGRTVQVKDASSCEFLKWFLAQLNFICVSNQSLGHSKQVLLQDIDTTRLDMDTRWYLLEEMQHLPSYPNSGVRLFVEDEQTGAA